jgi:hypothetical protein
MTSLSSSNQWIEAISILNDLTQVGKVTWRVSSTTYVSPPRLGGLSLLGTPVKYVCHGAFEAAYNGKTFRLTKFNNPAATLLTGDGDNAYLYVLDLLSDGVEMYRVPVAAGLNDLYRSIQHQVAGVDDVLQSLLGERDVLNSSQ